MHIELFLEEPSSEAFFQGFLPKILAAKTTWRTIVFQGKTDLLGQLEKRLKGYGGWIPDDWRIVVLVDEDREDCIALKQKMEAAARAAGLGTKTSPLRGSFTVLNRIAVEELEAWFFGDPAALAAAFSGVSPHLGAKAAYRNPDGISGGTWEALERVLKQAGHYSSGLPKIEVARLMSAYMEPSRNSSVSFQKFIQAVAAL